MNDPEIRLFEPTVYDPNCDADSFWDGSSLRALILPDCMVLRDDGVQKRSRRKDRAHCDGSRRFGDNWGERKVEVFGSIDAATKEALQTLSIEIKEFVGVAGIKMVYCDRYLNLTRLDRVTWPWSSDMCHEVVDARISWFASDPYWYDLPISSSTDPLVIGSNVFNLDTMCLYKVFPFITLTMTAPTGGGSDLIQLTNTDTGFNFILKNGITMAIGDRIEINSESGSVNAFVAAAGTDPIDIKRLYFGEYIQLQPGVNNFSAQANNLMDINIDWRCRTI